MQLLYLDFEFSDEDSGRGSFDAMASVLPQRLPALLAETAAVLAWARRTFGPPGEDDGEWDFELQAVAEPDAPLQASWDERRGEIALDPAPGGARVTLTLTLSGSPAFCEGLREAFGIVE